MSIWIALQTLSVECPFPVSRHGTAYRLLRCCLSRHPPFLSDGVTKWRDYIMVSLAVHRLVLFRPYPLIYPCPFRQWHFCFHLFLHPGFRAQWQYHHFLFHASGDFLDTGSSGSFLALVSSFHPPFTSNYSVRSFHFSDKSDIHFPLQS